MSVGAPCDRTPRQQGAPAPRGAAPAMRRDFHLPDDGITALDRFNARASGVEPTSPRPHYRADNDNNLMEEQE